MFATYKNLRTYLLQEPNIRDINVVNPQKITGNVWGSRQKQWVLYNYWQNIGR